MISLRRTPKLQQQGYLHMEIQLSNCRFGCLTPNKKSKWVREARNEGRGGGHGDHGFRQSRVSFTFKVFAHTT
ncbi:hypothetical protein HanRHA438_Chr12g0573041 [Helianthus annuus]|nr:hypothetical protein HanHA300_Chr12g0460861 [Helianthus annuus]KAJ0506803.1 hypothetical protein HanHA89_Chr12g0486261 [Helianthus annuus]KAJ0868297.1 hypothetical protein HanRHA438_Chr12g0573041 [Helianthus annuus]